MVQPVITDIPAHVCDNCGEAFVPEKTARRVHEVAEAELKKGVVVEVVHYAA
jgi:hypothetical protein